MSYIRESLYRTDFANISFAEYLQRLSANLIQSYSRSDCEVVLQTVFDEVYLSLEQAIPWFDHQRACLQLLEVCFPRPRARHHHPRIQHVEGVRWSSKCLTMGLVFPGWTCKNDSLGVYLVQALTEQIDGELVVTSVDQSRGCSFWLDLPHLSEAQRRA